MDFLKDCITKKNIKMDNTKLRNYAFDVFDYDTGTLSGLEKYIEWLEELVLHPKKLKKVLEEIEERSKW